MEMVYLKIYIYKKDLVKFEEVLSNTSFEGQERLDIITGLYKVIKTNITSLDDRKTYINIMNNHLNITDFDLIQFAEYEEQYKSVITDPSGIVYNLDFLDTMVKCKAPYKIISDYIDQYLSVVLTSDVYMTKYNDTVVELITLKGAQKRE